MHPRVASDIRVAHHSLTMEKRVAPRVIENGYFFKRLEALILAEGYSSLTVGDMAHRLQCSKRRLYEFAPTKEEIFLKVADGVFQEIRNAGFEDSRRYSNAPDKVRAYFALGTARTGDMGERFLHDLESLEAGRSLFDAHQKLRVQGMEQIILDGIKDGTFKQCNARFVAEVVLHVVQKLRERDFQDNTGVTLDGGFRAMYELVLLGIAQK